MPRISRKGRDYKKNPIEIVDPDPVYGRLAAGDVVSLRDQNNWPDDGMTIHEAVRERYRELLLDILSRGTPYSTSELDDDLDEMNLLLQTARLTVNFPAQRFFREETTNYQNSWERDDVRSYLQGTVDRQEQLLAQIGRDPETLPYSQRAAQQRINTYLSSSDALFQKSARPRYGALDYGYCYYGGAPLYGKSFLVLREHIKHRSLYTPKDSLNLSGEAEVDSQMTTFPDIEKLLLFCPWDMLKNIREYGLGFIQRGTDMRDNGPYLEAQMYAEISLEHDVAEIHVAVNRELDLWTFSRVQALRDRLRAYSQAYNVDIYEI